ncbi:MAG: exonuclease domain-containing protein [Bacteroidota bacterium]|jgi:DNA polymerase-3 subunit epsilon
MSNFTLNLNKPLAFFDLETTGVNIGADRIIEISILKIELDNSKDSKTWRINPGIPIPEFSSRIHGITDEMVKDCPDFKQVAPEIANFLEHCDLAGYNSNKFDVPLLVEEFIRVEVDFDLRNRKLIDVQNIFHFMEPRTLVAAYKFYCGKDHINAHSASADVEATFEVFCSQLEKYKEVQQIDPNGNKYFPVRNDMKAISELSTRTKNVDLAGRIVYNDKGQEVFNFGKYKDKPVTEVFERDSGYYSWMMNGDFPSYTKRIITKIRLEMKGQKK